MTQVIEKYFHHTYFLNQQKTSCTLIVYSAYVNNIRPNLVILYYRNAFIQYIERSYCPAIANIYFLIATDLSETSHTFNVSIHHPFSPGQILYVSHRRQSFQIRVLLPHKRRRFKRLPTQYTRLLRWPAVCEPGDG